MLKPRQITDYKGLTMAGKDKMATYEVIMPSDYLHILNCICIYRVNKTYKCYNAGDYWRSPATRLTADMYSQVLDNFWNKPTYKRPYYYIHNVNTSRDQVEGSGPNTVITHAPVPTNPYNGTPNDINIVQNSDIIRIGNFPVLYKMVNTTVNDQDTKQLCYLYDPSDNDQILVIKDGNIEFDDKSNYTLYTSNNITCEWDSVGGYYQLGDDTHLYPQYYISGGIGTGTDINEVETQGIYHNNPGSGTGNPETYDYGKDGANHQIVQGKGLPDTISVNINGTVKEASNRERGQGIRYGNVSQVRLEIRYGTDTSVFQLSDVYVDYIKAPQNIRLTQEEIDLTEDTSQMLEYPDYVCQEIINELVHLIMENISDQRLQTHPVVSQSIANPAQAQAPAQGQSAQ